MTKNNIVLNSNSITHNSNYVEYTDIIDDEKIMKRNYSNNVHNKIIKSISNSKSKSLSKTKNYSKIKNSLNKNELHGLIEDINKEKEKIQNKQQKTFQEKKMEENLESKYGKGYKILKMAGYQLGKVRLIEV